MKKPAIKITVKDETVQKRILLLQAGYPGKTPEEIVCMGIDCLWEKERDRIKDEVLELTETK